MLLMPFYWFRFNVGIVPAEVPFLMDNCGHSDDWPVR